MAVVPRKRARTTVYFVVTRGHWERVGTDRREAERLDAKRKKECKAGTFKPAAASGASTFRSYAEKWLNARTVAAAAGEAQMVRDYVLSRDWLAELRVDELRPHHMIRLVAELKVQAPKAGRTPTLSGKTVTLIMGVIRTMLRDAVYAEMLAGNPAADLPRGTLTRKGKKRQPYDLEPVRQLLAGIKHPTGRVFASLQLYCGFREGEGLGRRWRDWDRHSAPLGCMTATTQYDSRPLKTDEPRRIPVHPELAALLEWWWTEGWELTYRRKPTPDDWIVPPPRTPTRCYTRSGGYQLWRRLLAETGVTNLSLHSTRHTFTSLARRGGARKDVLERITHNARGEMIDHYTTFDWEPLCEAVLCLPSLDVRLAGILDRRLTRISEPQRNQLQRLDSNRGDEPKQPAIDGGDRGGTDIDVPVFLRETPLTAAKPSAGQGFPARVNLRALPLLQAALRMGVLRD